MRFEGTVTVSLLESDRTKSGHANGDQLRFDAIASEGVMTSPDLNRRARCVCSDYLRELGIHDPDVLARVSSHLVRKAEENASSFGPAAFESRLMLETLDVTDHYIQKWISGIEKQIDLRGGVSRCGEIAMRLPALLADHPYAIESVELAMALLQKDRSLMMPAQPPNTPTKFVGQPLIGSNRGLLAEMLTTLSQSIRSLLPVYRRRHAS